VPEDRQISIGPNALELATSKMKIHHASRKFLQVMFQECNVKRGVCGKGVEGVKKKQKTIQPI